MAVQGEEGVGVVWCLGTGQGFEYVQCLSEIWPSQWFSRCLPCGTSSLSSLRVFKSPLAWDGALPEMCVEEKALLKTDLAVLKPTSLNKAHWFLRIQTEKSLLLLY